MPKFEDVFDLTTAKLAHENRIRDLLKPRGEAGFGLDPDAPQVRDEQQKLDRVTAERTRLEKLKEARTARWTAVARLESAISDWLSGGVPLNCELVAVEDAPVNKLLLKGETAATAVERYRRQFSELANKLEQVRAAPWPSKMAIERATAQIEAMATPPDCKNIIDHLSPIGFASMWLTSTVRGGATPAVAFSEETINSAGLVAWLFKRELIAKVTDEIKQAARDGEALDEAKRATELREQMMECERAECSLIWKAEISDGIVIDFPTTRRQRWRLAFDRLSCHALRHPGQVPSMPVFWLSRVDGEPERRPRWRVRPFSDDRSRGSYAGKALAQKIQIIQ
ncbi:hypothetical protein [Bradyrhizobium sp. ARR65]|uniref:hypothetical protein n=1 Tax=Bradyrhizobium sp. ARR65 TaxID=1040989 RepID=UPI0012F7D08E|nr:hypothetical protein [Bradyrhizobium sp. ARR65]